MRITPDGLLGRRFWLLFAASSVTCISTGTITPILPQFIRNDLGNSATAVGLVVGTASLLAIVSNPALGLAADRFGRRTMGMTGAAVATLGVLGFLTATTLSAAGSFRALFGIGTIALNVALTAWIVDATRITDRGRALGLFGISVWIGLAVGPQLGQLLLYEIGFHAVWIAAAALQLTALACIACAPRRPRSATRSRERTTWAPVLAATVLPGAIAAAAWAGESILMSYLIVHLEDQGLDPAGLLSAAAIFTVFAVSVVVFRFALGSLTDRVAPHLVAIGGLLTSTLGYLVLAAAHNFPVAALGAVLLGFGFSPLYPALLLLATRHLQPTNRAAGLGVFTSGVELGVAAGALAGGILIDLSGGTAAMIGAAVFQLVAVALLLSRRWTTTDAADVPAGNAPQPATSA